MDDMPSFDLHLSLSQKFDEKIMEKGDSEVEKGDSEDGEKEGLYGEDAHLKRSQDENEVASDEADPIGAQKDNIILSEEVVLTPAHASINTQELQMHVDNAIDSVIKDLKKTEKEIEEEENIEMKSDSVHSEEEWAIPQAGESVQSLGKEKEIRRTKRIAKSLNRYTPNPTTEMKKRKVQ
ncbi:unnamed protein product, partial [Cuscuta europaea]